MTEKLHFDDIKEHRGSYMAEYNPPRPDAQFSTLNLTFLTHHNAADTVRIMEDEARHWLERFGVPLMVFSFDEKGDGIKPIDHAISTQLCAWSSSPSNLPITTWNLEDFSEFLRSAPPALDFKSIFHSINFRSESQIKSESDDWIRRRRGSNRALKFLMVLWLAVFPAVWAVFEFLGPEWIGAAILIYSLWKSVEASRRILGLSSPSQTEQNTARKKSLMAHYYYHCELNPVGFERLKCENFEREAIERIKKESESLRMSKD